MSGINATIAAKLSAASYTPLIEFQSGHGPKLPSGWRVDLDRSDKTPNGANQFIVFVNEAEKQAVYTFKGSDKYSNFESDILNAGWTEYYALEFK